MSYNYSYKSSSNAGGGAPVGGNLGGRGSNYSYSSSTSSGGLPRSGGLSHDPLVDAEFQNAKMAAMMGAPIGGTSNSTFRSTNTSAGIPSMDMDMERMRMEAEMGIGAPSGGNSSYTYKSSSSSGGLQPTGISVNVNPIGQTSGTKSVKKTVTTTTQKTNPQAQAELDAVTRDFSRIGRTPDNYQDDFEKIKREVQTGKAYEGSVAHSEPVVMKMREEVIRSRNDMGHPISPPISRFPSSLDSGLSKSSSTTTKTTTKRVIDGIPLEEETVTTTNVKGGGLHQTPVGDSETFIPIRRQDDSFNNLWMNRFAENSSDFDRGTDLDLQRRNWERQLSDMQRGFHSFNPSDNIGTQTIESRHTVNKNPFGNPEFSVQFEMRDYKPEDISLQTKFGKLHITAAREERIGGTVSRREFNRTVDLPSDVELRRMKSVFSRDGILSITAPIKAPGYNESTALTMVSPTPTDNSYSPSTYSRTSSINNNSYGSEKALSPASYKSNEEIERPKFCWTLPAAGYTPEDIEIILENRKLRIFGKHSENSFGGRKTYQEFRKTYDLPKGTDVDEVRCYIKNRHTLFIESELKDVDGDIQFVPITYK